MVQKIEDYYECFDGDNFFQVSNLEELKNKEKLIVEKNYCSTSNKLSIGDSYFSYIEMADELKKESDGLFNFYRTPTVKDMALNHFYNLTKAYQPTEISNSESNWINKASSHATTFWE